MATVYLAPNNIPKTEFHDLYAIDPILPKLFSYFLGKSFSLVEPHFQRMGRNAAAATPHSLLADQFGPKLFAFNPQGEKVNEVAYHPSYQELRRLSYGSQIVGYKYSKDFPPAVAAHRHLVGFGASFLFAQTETGLYCPICMTDALARVLEIHGKSSESQLAFSRLTSSHLENLWEGAMFLTERQGGSDVGANTVQAETEGQRWYLSGHKWFCSNVDASAILALARMPGADGLIERGTRGLGLFLILRDVPNLNYQTMDIHRLKEKLGVRSMASGEVTLNRTEAYLIGGANEGFKMMTDMVNMSRIYNSVASIAIARRSILEAFTYGRARVGFGRTLDQQPLWKSCLADLTAEQMAQQVLVFQTIKYLDEAEGGDEYASAMSRALIPIVKAVTGKFAVFSASEGMELVGGNAYIEDSIFPRLLRDAQVLPIWEGTTNILSLDLLRVLTKEGPATLLAELRNLKKQGGLEVKTAQEVEKDLEQFVKLSKEQMQFHARGLLERAARALAIGYLHQFAFQSGLKKWGGAVLERLYSRPHFTAPLGAYPFSVGEEAAILEMISC